MFVEFEQSLLDLIMDQSVILSTNGQRNFTFFREGVDQYRVWNEDQRIASKWDDADMVGVLVRHNPIPWVYFDGPILPAEVRPLVVQFHL